MASPKTWQDWAADRVMHANSDGIPIPSRQQAEWQDQELGMFFHFDATVYKPGWNWRTYKDLPSPEVYNPSKLDMDEWMDAAEAMGARYAVLVAKHCTGFLCWQSDLYPYGVKQSPWRGGRGDLVEEFIDACHRRRIRPGIYASVTANAYLEVDNPGVVNRGKGGDDAAQARYNRICEGMCEELWGRYGDLFEIWFDGGSLSPAEGGPDLVPILRRLQPDAMVFQGPAATIRWIGNERGVAGYPNWATVPETGFRHGSFVGDPDGQVWMPGECDVPIRKHEWFWQPNDDHKVYPLADLMDMYYRSVGRNANLLLNANPDPEGRIPAADMKRYGEFGREVRRRFSQPLASTSGSGSAIVLELPKPARVDHVIIMEDIRRGERIRDYALEALQPGGDWQVVAEGSSVGHKRIEGFEPIETPSLRLSVRRSVAEPRIRRFQAFSTA